MKNGKTGVSFVLAPLPEKAPGKGDREVFWPFFVNTVSAHLPV